jgi:hypothetical protein
MAGTQTQLVRTRPLNAVPYLANNPQTVDLDIGGVVREIGLTLAGQLTATLGNNVVANMLEGDEWGLIAKVQIIANGGDYIRDIAGPDIWQLQRFLYRNSPRVSVQLANGVANPAFNTTLILPFMMPDAAKPFDYAWNTAGLRDLKCTITWRDHTKINSAATGFTVAPTLNLSVYESFMPAGQPAPGLVTRIQSVVAAPAAAQNNYVIKLPAGGQKIRALAIKQQDTGGNASVIISRFRIVAGGTTIFDQTPQQIADWHQGRGKLAVGFERALNYSGGVTGDGTETGGYPNRMRQNSKEAAWQFLPFTYLYESEALDTGAYNDVHIDCDVTAAGTITVYPITYVGDLTD